MLHQHNQRMANIDPVTKKGSYNLKGYIVANGVTDFNFDVYVPQSTETFAHYGVIPYSQFLDYKKNNCSLKHEKAIPNTNLSPACKGHLDKLTMMLYTGQVDFFDITGDKIFARQSFLGLRGETLPLKDRYASI